MERLAKENFNTAEEYDSIFKERQLKKTDLFDLKRWKLLAKYFKGGKVIDLGCLDSLAPFIIKINYPSAEVWGLDQAKETIEFLKNKYPMITYIQGDVYKTGFPNEYFNYVVAGELIEHLEEPERFIKEAFRILKPNGILALSTPLNEKLEVGAVDKEHHLWSFTTQDIKSLVRLYGSARIKIIGSSYVPKYKYNFPVIISWIKKYEN